MKRKWILAGIFLGLGVAVVLVVVLAQPRDETTVAQSGFTMTTNGQLVVLPRSGYGVMSVVAELPKTNHPGTSLKP